MANPPTQDINQLIYGQFQPQFPVAQPSVSAVTSQEENIQSQAQQILASAGFQAEGSTLSSQDILDLYAAHGIDIANPTVQSTAQAFAQLPADQQSAAVNLTSGAYQTQYPAAKGTYATAYQNLGLGEVQFPEPLNPQAAENQTEAQLKSSIQTEQPTDLPSSKTKNYVFTNGVFYYRNGVIADPQSNSVLYDPSKPQTPGSPLWLTKAQRSWSPEQVDNWRTQLHKLGYDIAKKGAWDTSLVGATQAYYSSKYLNGGNVIANQAGPGTGAGTTGSPPLDLHQLSASIQDSVQRQYQSVFGQDPTPEELKSWTQFVINQGMKLQQGGARKSLSPDAALSEAEARAARQIYQSPEAQTWMDNQQENTRLHDAMTSAISATRALA